MGFLDNLGRGLSGAATGFLSSGGNPLGAIAGGAAGLMSSGQGATQTSGYNLRPLTSEEQGLISSAQGSMQANISGMTPEQQQAYVGQLADTYYQPMAQQIGTSYQQGMGQQRAALGRGGMLGSSAAQAAARGATMDMAQMQGQAQAQARQMGEQSFMNMEQNRRANLGSAQNVIGGIRQMQMGMSPQYTTQNNPNQFANSMMYGLGMASQNPGASQGAMNGLSSAVGWLGNALGFGGGGGGATPNGPSLNGLPVNPMGAIGMIPGLR